METVIDAISTLYALSLNDITDEFAVTIDEIEMNRDERWNRE